MLCAPQRSFLCILVLPTDVDSESPAAAIRRVTRIGDALAPGTIAAATWSGHRFARELGEPLPDGPTYRYELPALAETI